MELKMGAMNAIKILELVNAKKMLLETTVMPVNLNITNILNVTLVIVAKEQ